MSNTTASSARPQSSHEEGMDSCRSCGKEIATQSTNICHNGKIASREFRYNVLGPYRGVPRGSQWQAQPGRRAVTQRGAVSGRSAPSQLVARRCHRYLPPSYRLCFCSSRTAFQRHLWQYQNRFRARKSSRWRAGSSSTRRRPS